MSQEKEEEPEEQEDYRDCYPGDKAGTNQVDTEAYRYQVEE